MCVLPKHCHLPSMRFSSSSYVCKLNCIKQCNKLKDITNVLTCILDVDYCRLSIVRDFFWHTTRYHFYRWDICDICNIIVRDVFHGNRCVCYIRLHHFYRRHIIGIKLSVCFIESRKKQWNLNPAQNTKQYTCTFLFKVIVCHVMYFKKNTWTSLNCCML